MPTHPNQRNHASPLRAQRCCAVLTRELQLRCSSAPVHWWQHHQQIYPDLRPCALRWSLVQLVAVVLIDRETGGAEHRAVLTFNSFSKHRAAARRRH